MTKVAEVPLDPFVHREASLQFAGRRLSFLTSLGLFSSHRVDVGSHLLLRTLEPLLAAPEAPAEGRRVLDLGCGYGPLGVALATLPGVASAHLLDRDALALDFAQENAHRNGVEERVTTAAGLCFDGLPEDDRYDLVVSNVPGKAGDAVIASMLLGALGVLAPDGIAAVVIIEPIRDLVASTLTRDDIEVTLRRDTADYSVFHYRPAPDATFPRPLDGFAARIYDGRPITFEDPREERVTIATVQGVSGVERVDAADIEMMQHVPRLRAGTSVAISNVGQGALAAWLLRAQPEVHLLLIDRDLLALRAARRTLLALGCTDDHIEARHLGVWGAATLDEARADLVVATLHEDAGAPAVEAQYAGLLGGIAPGGRAVIAGSSTAITRLVARPLPAGMSASRTRHRGISILEVTRAD